MATERMTTRVREGFDPTNQAHVDKLLENLQKKMPEKGTGWKLQSYDPSTQEVTWTRQSAITQVTKSAGRKDSYDVALPAGTKPVDGDQMAAKLESDPRHLGYTMTAFEPYLGQATLSRMTPEALRCRGAVANALRCKPWDIPVTPRADGGFSIKLPRTYVPSQHDAKILEVAEQIVGRPGWYTQINPQQLTAEIIPADPPTFPGAIPYDFDAPIDRFVLGDDSWAKIPLGRKLAPLGETEGEIMYLDLEAAPHAQLSGTSGSGKTVTINAFLAGALARGASLAVVDLNSKSVDFLWAKKWVRDGGWGCDSLEGSATTMALIYEEGQRRAKVLADAGVTKWTELPEGYDMPPIVVLVDELTGLFFPEKVPKLDKEHPLVVEAQATNAVKAQLEAYIKKIAAEMRFVGIKLLLSSQVSSTNTGVDTSLRMNLANKMLLGANPTDGNRRLSLTDAGRVPKVPGNIQSDGKASRGVGVAELEGQEPCVFKTAFATVQQYEAWLSKFNLRESPSPSPTAAQISRVLEGDTAGAQEFGKKPRELEAWEIDPETGQPWKDPRQRANAAKHALSS